MNMLLIATTILGFFALQCVAGSGWSYSGEHGPAHWKDMAGNAKCAGQSQSPIDIKGCKKDSTLTAFDLSKYDKAPKLMTLLNNGHAAQVNVECDITITGGSLPATYKVAQFHFHWGADDTKGSEHQLDGKKYPMEMHIVHHSEKYETLGAAADKPEGLAVLGFFFEVVAEDNPAYNFLFNNVNKIRRGGATMNITSFALSKLIPASDQLGTYYRYPGSLTTPGCYESVVWTVFRTGIKVSANQMKTLRTLMTSGDHPKPLVDNFRPVQALNGRTIRKRDTADSGHQAFVASPVAIVVLLVAKYLL